MSTFSPLPPAPPSKPRKRLGLKIAIGIAFLAVIGAALIWKVGKSTYRDYRIVSAAADLFHQQLNAGDYDEIYENATEEFRHSGKREDLNHLLDNIRSKMGRAGKPSAIGFHVNWRNGVLWADQTFTTQFEKGNAQEYFVWKIEQDQPHLYNYRIDSPNMQGTGANR